MDVRIKVLGIGLILLTSSAIAKIDSHENSPKKVKAHLSTVQDQIKKLEKRLYNDKSAKNKLMQHLAQIEKEIGDRSEDQRVLNDKLQKQYSTLHQLEQDARQLDKKTHSQQIQLSKLLQATYAHYHQEKLRIMLNQHELPQYARLNEYYQFFYLSRANQIKLLQHELAKVEALKLSILQERNILEELNAKAKEEQHQLLAKKNERKEILSQINSQLNNAESSLQGLQQEQAHLEQLFKTLQESLNTSTTSAAPMPAGASFAKMKHQLQLPISGNVKLSTVAQIKKLKSKKSYIASDVGTPVQAIYGGRVVFAEWLRGVGLLIIVDHGHGYMSLYGNNQKLYKGLGETVKQGEMIARVGQSGGHSEPGLYFEIRKDGEALDPTPWFKTA